MLCYKVFNNNKVLTNIMPKRVFCYVNPKEYSAMSTQKSIPLCQPKEY